MGRDQVPSSPISGFIAVCKFIVSHLQDGGRCAVFSVASFHGSFRTVSLTYAQRYDIYPLCYKQ